MPRTEITIEVATAANQPNDEKGKLVEALAADLLRSQNCKVIERLRLTGVEVDLLAEDRQTGETVLVECKGQRNPISAHVLTQIHGTRDMKRYGVAWLVTTSTLTKDAKGLCEEWRQRPPEERRKLQVYEPDTLLQRIEDSGIVKPAESILSALPSRSTYAQPHFLLTTYGRYWAIPLIDPSTALRSAVAVFHAESGEPVSDQDNLQLLRETDTSLADLQWLAGNAVDPAPDALKLQDDLLQSIVAVPQSENWTDPRPARPEDFVGREDVLSTLLQFFDRVQNRVTNTRNLAIRAPSGWGKSSIILKLANRARRRRSRPPVFVIGLDCRSASSKRYPELALRWALTEAQGIGFLPREIPIELGLTTDLFKSDTLCNIATYLESQNKILCIIFDQFEELFFKHDLSPVFDEIKRFCFAVDELQSNVVLGFSWKTDATLPSEHKAYYLWHELSDRRAQFDIPDFSNKDISSILTRLSKETGESLSSPLRRFLRDNCQGYPWLLKKTMHTYTITP